MLRMHTQSVRQVAGGQSAWANQIDHFIAKCFQIDHFVPDEVCGWSTQQECHNKCPVLTDGDNHMKENGDVIGRPAARLKNTEQLHSTVVYKAVVYSIQIVYKLSILNSCACMYVW